MTGLRKIPSSTHPESAADDEYKTLSRPAVSEWAVKGSRFLGHAQPVDNRQDAEKIIHGIEKTYHDATHHCYAYRLRLGGSSSIRSSDAGEPSGTAGKPILGAIVARDLRDVVCVVVRYFGGIKLGTGGLARAYGVCASNTLDQGETVTRYLVQAIRLTFDYAWTGTVMALISSHEGRIRDTSYDDRTTVTVEIRRSRIDGFCRNLLDSTSGQVIASTGE
jgi:uncharacterized YigZ family protein